MFKVGDKVRLNPNKDDYTYGKGNVLYTDVGEITDILFNDVLSDCDVCVNFPNSSNWHGKEDELVLYAETNNNIEISDNGVSLTCTVSDDSIIKAMLEDYPLDFEEYCNSKFKDELIEREEKDMNKVLKLYEDRKHAEINKKYEEKIDNDLNSIDIIKQYKTLIENFEKEQESLFKTIENFDNDYLVPSCDSNCYKYKLNTSSAKKELMDKYREEWEKELSSLYELTAEVDAQLSLSDDLNYQMEVLTRYDILDKKTNKVKA